MADYSLQYAVLNPSDKPSLFPTRTLLLMVLALVAFGRLWCVTHQTNKTPPAATPVEVQLAAPVDGGIK